jgi:hypothetical protein
MNTEGGTPHFVRCYKCNGEKEVQPAHLPIDSQLPVQGPQTKQVLTVQYLPQVTVKRKRVHRGEGEARNERIRATCGVCKGQGGIYGLKKIKNQDAGVQLH